MPLPELMLATSNPGKTAELSALLHPFLGSGAVTLRTLRDWPGALPDVAETGTTFAENALLKAQTLASATGLVCLADDSGLCVDALGGAPGVRSARWGGENATDAERNLHLLHSLASVPEEARTARFVCVVALADPAGRTAEAEGVCEGRILVRPRGFGGFGYDPLFLLTEAGLPESGRTLAELSAAEKNRCSHRARAVALLAPPLRAFLRFPV